MGMTNTHDKALTREVRQDWNTLLFHVAWFLSELTF
jgi:hypothetical protein